MKKLVITLDIDNFQRPNSRESMESAASRWGADFIAVRARPFGNDFGPTYTKVFLDEYASGYDEIVFFDADCIIRSDTPTPFTLIIPEKIRAVQNGNERIGNYQNTLAQHNYNLLRINQQQKLLEHIDNVNEYFNTGFLLTNIQTLRKLCHLVRCILPEMYADRHNPIYEQALFNYAARCMSSSIDTKIFEYAEECWNYMYPSDLTQNREWVYHISSDIKNRNEIIDNLKWRMS